MQSFHKVVEADFAAVNRLIIEKLHSDVDLVENIGHYIVDAGGKRLRPLLVLLTSNALGYQGSAHIELAAIIEFIHTATLLHDDVVDVSSLRRGRPTANAQWGNAPSILVGDFLYSRAFQMMVAVGDIDVMAIMSNTTNVISEGEVQQLVNTNDPDVSEQNYLVVIHKKTAALFEAACEIGAVIAGASATQRACAKQIGYHLGVAFQLVDDALDYQGDAASLGKNVGDDLAEGKPTLPLIHAITHSSDTEVELIRAAIRAGGIDKLQQIISIVRERGGLEYTMRCANTHADEALALIEQLPASPFQSALADLTRFSVNRTI
ncbi:octaprenyl-diphosphate synthase [Alteromonadaceae bacterium 2753L.S.0a.02]|nr:octaprenyl-diphosphate synthase [Alteromonadaceae bacterium 2753L.S.0a.02]